MSTAEKSEKTSKEAERLLFLYSEVYGGAQKINKMFTISKAVLTNCTIMLKKHKYRFKTLKCQEQNAKKISVSISIFPILGFTNRTKLCIIVDV